MQNPHRQRVDRLRQWWLLSPTTAWTKQDPSRVEVSQVRSYGQFCSLARSLDIVGERWTLLIVRDLMLGPQRFTDLLTGLPTIGPNLLSRRLRTLEDRGLIARRRLPAPSASQVYELTRYGRGLEPVLLALAHWGMEPIAPPTQEDQLLPHWYAIGMWAAFRPDQAPDHDESYQFEVDDTIFHLEVRDGRTRAARGPAHTPAFTLRASLNDFLALVTRSRQPDTNELDGPPDAYTRFIDAHALPAPR